jgi:hypothetical protein
MQIWYLVVLVVFPFHPDRGIIPPYEVQKENDIKHNPGYDVVINGEIARAGICDRNED